MTVKPFQIQIVDVENQTSQGVDCEGYSLVVLDEDGTEGFVASHLTEGLDLAQLALLIDAMIEEEPRLQILLDDLAAKRIETKTDKEDA